MAKLPRGITFTSKSKPGYGRALTPHALAFVAQLHRAFEGERQRLLALRAERQKLFDKRALPDFRSDTAAIRAGAWKVGTIPLGLQDRRVEIRGPTDRKTVIEAFNSGAKVFVADFGESNSPAWDNLVQGHLNLMDRWTSKMEFIDPLSGKRQGLTGKPAVLMVRPRGLHLDEVHMMVDGKPVAGGFFDFGVYFFHNAKAALSKTSGPYFCLPKLESHLEARLWNQIFIAAQSLLGLRLGTIKTTVMIESLPAAFEMDEIIFELRDHLVGLNCGHSGLIFSFIKAFHNRRNYLLPDLSQITASGAFLAAYSALLVKTCHRRGCLALGDTAFKAEMEHEARGGFDGTAVAQPELVPAALKVFNELMPTSNQLYVAR
ncbi:MAG TPA: malate synthase A, partial [Aestuariivirga sp.]|nr:malate synthase A [Aestuariivirga sp.]